jgi:hypothetical protein
MQRYFCRIVKCSLPALLRRSRYAQADDPKRAFKTGPFDNRTAEPLTSQLLEESADLTWPPPMSLIIPRRASSRE